jgi:histidinol-phosphatase (PHP family)
MIRSALLRDFEVLGFSGHSFTAFDTSYCMSKDGLIDYLDEIDSAKKFFEKDPEAAKAYYAPEIVNAGDLRIYTGIEQDLYSERPALRKHEGLLNPG